MDNNYSFYLFCKLKDIISPSEEPYDLLYGKDLKMFEDYNNSIFSLQYKGEYDCMDDYLKYIAEPRYNIVDRDEEALAHNLTKAEVDEWLIGKHKPLYLIEKI